MITMVNGVIACGCCAAAGFNAGLWVAATTQGLRTWLYPWIIVGTLLLAMIQFWAGSR